MKELISSIQSSDIYFLDQIIKGRLTSTSRVLDAGCGGGRNLQLLIQHKVPFIAIDEDTTTIRELKQYFPENSDQFIASTVEHLQLENQTFDFIICNAVLHFARSHDHFEMMFQSLIRHLAPEGIIFIRMTSNIGMENRVQEISSGVYEIPDGSIRYLLTKKMLQGMLEKYNLQLMDPLKSTLVEGEDLNEGAVRVMSTLVVTKK